MKKWPSKMPRLPLPERQRTAFAIMIEGLGGDRAIDVYNAGGPADLVVAHGNHTPERRHAAGQETMVREKIFKRCGWPDDHQVAAGRSEIFDPVEAKPSAAGGAWWGPQWRRRGRSTRWRAPSSGREAVPDQGSRRRRAAGVGPILPSVDNDRHA
jgi:hypothetical protein